MLQNNNALKERVASFSATEGRLARAKEEITTLNRRLASARAMNGEGGTDTITYYVRAAGVVSRPLTRCIVSAASQIDVLSVLGPRKERCNHQVLPCVLHGMFANQFARLDFENLPNFQLYCNNIFLWSLDRLRKCPGCGAKFGEMDVKRLYIGDE